MSKKRKLQHVYPIPRIVCMCILSCSSLLLADNKAWTTDQEKKLMELYKEGLDVSEIYSDLGRSYEAVRQKLTELKTEGRLKIYNESENYRIELTEEKQCDTCPNKVAFVFKIFDKKEALSREYVLHESSGPDIVYNVKLWGKRAAILGRRGDKPLYVVSMLNLETLEYTNCFWAYKLSLSPSGRFFAYVKFYSRHQSSISDIVLIYDLAKSGVENCLAGYCGTKTDSGIPVYPRENVISRSYNQSYEKKYIVASPILWSKDSNDIVFLCNYEGRTNTARVNLCEGVEKPGIYEAPINIADFMKPDLLEEFKRQKASQLNTISATEIVWDGEDHVIVTRGQTYYMLQEKIRLPVPK